MKENKICHHCGAKMVEYKFSFNKGMATFLIALYRENGPCKTDQLGLTYSQRTNSQKLRYWGLAEPFENEESRIKKGWWKITTKGSAFVENRITIQKQVVMYRNELRHFEGESIFISNVVAGYDFRKHYQDQASLQIRGS